MSADTMMRPSFEGDYYLWALDQARRLRAVATMPKPPPYTLEQIMDDWLPARPGAT